MAKAQSLAVHIPLLGWEANITSEHLENARATVASLSIGGAYLITEAKYEPGSIVTLWIRSSQLSFFVTAKIQRKDPYGIAVRFLDLCGSHRSAILKIICRFLFKTKAENPVEKKYSVCSESHSKDYSHL